MKSLGFTGAGYYSYNYISHFPAGGLPYEVANNFGLYAMRDATNGITGVSYRVKDAGWIPNKAGMHCAPTTNLTTPDPYDPEFATAYNAMYAVEAANHDIFNMSNTILFQADDGDYVGVMNSCCNPNNAHPDYGYIIAANSPVQAVSGTVGGNQAGGVAFSNKTYFVKLAMRDFLAAEYGCTGSADPANGSYCGLSAAATALIAFNAAWHTSFTTWNTSDSGGIAGIASGAYASWGTGTGFLDENGSHLSVSVGCGGTDGNGLQQNQAWTSVPQIQTDVDGFMAFGFAPTWATQIYNAYAAGCSTTVCPPLSLPIYDGPNSRTLQVSIRELVRRLLESLSLFCFGLGPPFYNSTAGFAAEVQSIINNDDNFPVMVGTISVRIPDSYVNRRLDDGGCGVRLPSQRRRCAGRTGMINNECCDFRIQRGICHRGA